MPAAWTKVDRSDPRAEALAGEAAGADLRAGRVCVLPLETVYAFVADVTAPGGAEALAALAGARAPAPWTWHAPSVEAVERALGSMPRMHRRLLRGLAPGPARFLFERSPEDLARVRGALGVGEGLIDDGGALAVRVTDDPIARAALGAAGVCVAVNAGALGLGDGRTLEGDEGGTGASAPTGMVVDAGPTRLGVASTTLRLTGAGGYGILREGAYDARWIEKMTTRTILFVCTGNTCRSPMAEAIAAHLIAERDARAGDGLTTRVGSAGAMTSGGAPISGEALEALGSMGVSPTRTRSRELTRELVASADRIYAMTRGHLDAIARIDAGARAELLDPDGGDVPDPIGSPASIYLETAEAMRGMIERRLEELDA